MTLIQKIIKVRGLTQKQLCEQLGLPYHSFIKVVGLAPYRLKSGEVRHYNARHIRQAVADWLGVPYDLVWGPNAGFFLKRLLKEEIEQQLEIERQKKLRAFGL